MFEVIQMKNVEAAEEVWALQHAAYRVEAAIIGVTDLPPLHETVESLRHSNETFYGFRSPEGELAGALSFAREQDGRYFIGRLMVHPEYFRQGIGFRLLSYLLAAFPTVHWTVTAEARNSPALALYEKVGFVRISSYEPAPGITLHQLERTPLRL